MTAPTAPAGWTPPRAAALLLLLVVVLAPGQGRARQGEATRALRPRSHHPQARCPSTPSGHLRLVRPKKEALAWTPLLDYELTARELCLTDDPEEFPSQCVAELASKAIVPATDDDYAMALSRVDYKGGGGASSCSPSTSTRRRTTAATTRSRTTTRSGMTPRWTTATSS